MQRHQSHIIDEKAKQIFRASLPTTWIVREQNPDYGIDFIVELAEPRTIDSLHVDTTGITFAVQLKGKKTLAIGAGGAAVRVEIPNLVDWFDNSRQPVFVVAVDVTSKEAFWLFVQPYAVKKLRNGWRKQKTVTLLLPEQQRLADSNSLRQAVLDADKFMTEFRPGSITGSITAHKQKMESLDTRFNISVTATENSCNFEVRAKDEPVSVTMSFQGDAARKQQFMNDFYGRGVPVKLAPGELHINGSPLFETYSNEFKEIHATRTMEVVMLLRPTGVVGADLNIPSKIEGGVDEQRVTGTLPNAAVDLSMKIRREGSKGRAADFSLTFPLERWFGQEIRLLAYFDQIAEFFEKMAATKHFDLAVLKDGNRILELDNLGLVFDDTDVMLKFVDQVKRIRAIAAFLDIHPKLNPQITPKEVEDALSLEWLIEPSERAVAAPNATASGEFDREMVERISKSTDPEILMRNVNTVKVVQLNFLGVNVSLPGVVENLSVLRLETPREEIRQLLEDPNRRSCPLRWHGTPQTILQRSLPSRNVYPDAGHRSERVHPPGLNE